MRSEWESFYVIVGSSGGALIGLQFVVITLIAERRKGTHDGALAAFGTPTVVHLAGALVVSAVMSAPWPSTGLLSTALFVGGVLGVTYGATSSCEHIGRQATSRSGRIGSGTWLCRASCTSH